MSSSPSSRSTTTRRLLTLSLPLAGTQLANIALAATDTAVLGHLGVAELAGGGLAVVWFNQIRTMAVGLLTPLGNRIAETDARTDLSAQRRQDEVRELSRLGVLLATVAGVVGALILVGIGLVLPWLGQGHEVSRTAFHVMVALAPGLVPCLWFQAIRQFTIGLEHAKALLGITIGSVLVNLVLDLALAHGWEPLPSLGAVGVGLATALVHLAMAVTFITMVRRDADLRPLFDPRPGGVSGDLMRSQLRLGLPVAATYGAEAGMFSALAMVMGTFGSAALAAHNVVYQVTFIVFQVGVGFSHGGSILVSRFRGEDNTDGVRGVGMRMLAIMGGLVAVAAVVFLVAPRTVLEPFLGTGHSDALDLSVELLAIGALMEFADTAQNLGIGALRGLGDTVTGLRASLIGYWVIGLPAALLFAFPLGLGPHGVWWGLTVGLAVAAGMLWRRFALATSSVG